MKFNIIVLLLTSLFQVQLATSQSAPFQKLIEERFLSFPNNAEVAIGMVDGNNTYKLGYQVMDGKLIAVDNASTLYEIGSISKTFVAALLTNEIEKGTMSLEDPIQTHFLFRNKEGQLSRPNTFSITSGYAYFRAKEEPFNWLQAIFELPE
ncbi:MAG: serine hydrolase [Bacteroidota bacterium]